MYSWGLIPRWAKDDSIQQNTLNAKIETIHEKPSFRDVIQKRCLVLIDGFYKWKWLDEKGKHKQKYLITLPTHEAFACAGLYSHWRNKNTGETINTYTILTTEANELMSEIHNSKKRIPVIIHSSNEQSWLSGEAHKFTQINLMATEV